MPACARSRTDPVAHANRENSALRAELARSVRLLDDASRINARLAQQRDRARARCVDFRERLRRARVRSSSLRQQRRDAVLAYRRIRDELCSQEQIAAVQQAQADVLGLVRDRLAEYEHMPRAVAAAVYREACARVVETAQRATILRLCDARPRTLLVQLPPDAPPRSTTITLPAAGPTTIIRLPARASAV